MAIHPIDVGVLTECASLEWDLLGADGHSLMARGERLAREHIALLRSIGISQVFVVDTEQDRQKLAADAAVIAVPPLDAREGQVLARDVRRENGALVVRAGTVLRRPLLERLARFGIPLVYVPVDEQGSPRTQRFLEGKARLQIKKSAVYSPPGSLGLKRRAPRRSMFRAAVEDHEIEYFVSTWIDICDKYASTRFVSYAGERRCLVDDADFAWLFQTTGDIQTTVLVSIQRGCALGLTRVMLHAPDFKPDDDAIVSLLDNLIKMLMEDTQAMAERADQWIAFSAAVAMSGRQAVTNLPASSPFFSVPLQCPFGRVRLTFRL